MAQQDLAQHPSPDNLARELDEVIVSLANIQTILGSADYIRESISKAIGEVPLYLVGRMNLLESLIAMAMSISDTAQTRLEAIFDGLPEARAEAA